MRIFRSVPIVSVTLAFAGCAASTDDPADTKDSQVLSAEDDQSQKLAGELALQHVTARPELGLRAGDVSVRRVWIDETGEAHVRIGQTIGGVPVFEGEAIVHVGADGKFNSMTGKILDDVEVDLTPAITDRAAANAAVLAMGGKDLLLGKPDVDMQILRRGGVDHLTYRVRLDMRTAHDEPTMPVVFVSAHTGKIVWSYDNLETAINRATYTAKQRTNLPGTLLRSEGQGPVSDAVANQAHDNAGHVWNYYWNRHGRDSFDGAGAQIRSTVHYSRNYVNAFWNGTQMVYGDGDGVLSGPLTVLDVVGHEITHAVTERSSNLTYANESGALNEAMSDIFGAAVEAYRDGAVSANTWKIGEECWTPATPGDSLRQMDDPALYGDYDYWPTRYTGTSDNGGVHWNSGIANLAFALAVKGGTHPRGKTSVVVPALDSNALTSIQMGAAIFYRANTQCLTSGSTFQDASGCTQQAASALYGATAASSIAAAWAAVGVPAPLVYTVIDTQTGLSASRNGKLEYSYGKPAGATAMRFTLAGNNGDADLYVRRGAPPTTSTYDCRSAGATSNESCTISNAADGTYYVMINAYSAYTGLTFQVSSGQ
ncbi:MAG TPA: M4 family metallopeptidase [Kofleriaceae bacterium]|nr:M4 family metallopeptidase [Kofleriaceae bacterium]